MSRSNAKYNKWSEGVFGQGHFAQLKEELFFSTAFANLDPQSKLVLLTMFMQYKGEKYTDKLTIICPYTEFKRIGIKQSKTISKCIAELEEFGFITVKRSNLRKVPNEYTFTGKWRSITAEQVPTIKARVKARMNTTSEEWKRTHPQYEYKPTPNQRARANKQHNK